MDIFVEHGVAGILGLLANALFGATYIIGLDGVNTGTIVGGWVSQNYRQLYVQIAYILAAVGWSFVMSLIMHTQSTSFRDFTSALAKKPSF